MVRLHLTSKLQPSAAARNTAVTGGGLSSSMIAFEALKQLDAVNEVASVNLCP